MRTCRQRARVGPRGCRPTPAFPPAAPSDPVHVREEGRRGGLRRAAPAPATTSKPEGSRSICSTDPPSRRRRLRSCSPAAPLASGSRPPRFPSRTATHAGAATGVRREPAGREPKRRHSGCRDCAPCLPRARGDSGPASWGRSGGLRTRRTAGAAGSSAGDRSRNFGSRARRAGRRLPSSRDGRSRGSRGGFRATAAERPVRLPGEPDSRSWISRSSPDAGGTIRDRFGAGQRFRRAPAAPWERNTWGFPSVPPDRGDEQHGSSRSSGIRKRERRGLGRSGRRAVGNKGRRALLPATRLRTAPISSGGAPRAEGAGASGPRRESGGSAHPANPEMNAERFRTPRESSARPGNPKTLPVCPCNPCRFPYTAAPASPQRHSAPGAGAT